MKVGLIARMDATGLGQGQTLRLARLLKPHRIMLIDSSPFNGNLQYPRWYDDYKTEGVIGFPNDKQIKGFLSELDVVISCELFYNMSFTIIAKRMNVKTVLIANPEFFDWFKPQWIFVPPPDKVIVPSEWMMKEMSAFNAEYLPTPIFDDEFAGTRKANLKRIGRKYLFMNGRTAVHDRNGLLSLYEALKYSKGDYSIVIKSQSNVPKNSDKRLSYDFSNPTDQSELYKGFDALIQPRRYGGQTLSMTEALLCGLPVIMTDISPNNKVLPKEWLVPATKTGEFMTRTLIDIYSADPRELAHKLDTLDTSKEAKLKAYEIGKQYEAESLRPKYEELFE